MTTETDEKRTKIRIGLPLPLDVAGTLLQLIGRAYPDCIIHQEGHREMVLSISDAQRIDPDSIDTDGLPLQADEDLADAALTELGPQGVGMGWPEKLAAEFAGMAAGMLEAFPDAKNYLETQFTDRDDPTKEYVLIVARSKGQTPHQLRQAAEARVAELEAENAQLRDMLAELGPVADG